MDHKTIREALEAGPTEGPWVADDNEGFSPWSIWSRMSPTGHGEAGPKIAQIQLANDEADATFIAACNPAAIRALLADLDAKTAEVERLQALHPVAMTKEALPYLRELVKALDGAFISSWQSTHAWQQQLDAARQWLAQREQDTL